MPDEDPTPAPCPAWCIAHEVFGDETVHHGPRRTVESFDGGAVSVSRHLFDGGPDEDSVEDVVRVEVAGSVVAALTTQQWRALAGVDESAGC